MTVSQETTETSLPRDEAGVARSLLIVSAGSLVSQALGVVTTPLAARLFSPEAFGVAGVFSSIVGILSILASLQYDRAITLPKQDREAANLLVLCLGLNLLLGAAATAVWLALPPAAWERLDAPELADHAGLFFVSLILAAVSIPLVTWAQRLQRFGSVSLSRVLGSLGNTVTTLTVGFVGYTSGVALAAGRTWGGQVAQPAALLLTTQRAELRFVVRAITLRGMRDMARRYRDFPLYALPASLLDLLGRESPSLLFAAFYGAEVTGLYALSSRLMRIPADLVARAVGEVLYARASAAQASGAPLAPLVAQSSQRLTTAAAWPVLALAAGTLLFGPSLFGQKWTLLGHYTVALAPSILVMFVHSPLTVLFTVLEAHRANLSSQTILSACYIIPIVVGTATGLDTLVAIAVYSLTIAAANLWRLVLLWRLSGVSVRVQLGHFVRQVLFASPSVAVAAAGWVLGWHPLVSGALLLLGAVPYFWLSVWVDPELLGMAKGLAAGAVRRVRAVLR